MKRPLHIILACTALLAACDKRKEAIEKFSMPPEISFGYENSSDKKMGNTVTDSLKLNSANQPNQIIKPGHRSHNIKSITVKYDNKNKDIASIKFTSSSRNANLFYHGHRVIDFLPIDANELKLDFENDAEELTSLEFSITDKFNNTSKIVYNIFSFVNLAPIASLSYRHSGITSKYEYELDASKSFDEDRNQGGSVEWYVFHVDAHEIRTKASKLDYVFNKPGTYPVDLTVIDNQGKASRTISKSITVKPDSQ